MHEEINKREEVLICFITTMVEDDHWVQLTKDMHILERVKQVGERRL